MKNRRALMRILKNEEPLRIVVDNRELENVSQFRYFESLLNRGTDCTKEIREKIAMAKVALNKKRTLLTGKSDLQLKKKLLKCYV